MSLFVPQLFLFIVVLVMSLLFLSLPLTMLIISYQDFYVLLVSFGAPVAASPVLATIWRDGQDTGQLVMPELVNVCKCGDTGIR
jgi:hypothetical protein